METWFLDLVEKTTIFNDVLLEIIADDQELTLGYLKKGLVSACLSTSDKEITGGCVTPMGTMEYVLVASPKFIKKHFPKGITKKSLLQAPSREDEAEGLTIFLPLIATNREQGSFYMGQLLCFTPHPTQ